MVHELIDTLAAIHYPAGLLIAGFATTLLALPYAGKKATK